MGEKGSRLQKRTERWQLSLNIVLVMEKPRLESVCHYLLVSVVFVFNPLVSTIGLH